MSSATPRVKNPLFKIALYLLYAVFLAIYVYLLFDGSSLYSTPYQERPHHEEYRVLRPAGIKGHTFGVIGASFLVLMLSYSLRKRAKLLRSSGMLSRWLDIHILLGISGTLLIILHTSFKVQGLVAVSFWSMVAVASSGIFGRYLYLQIPRNIQGDEIGIKDLEADREKFTRKLKEEYCLSDDAIKRLEGRASRGLSEEAGALKVLLTIVKDDVLKFLSFGRTAEDLGLKDVPPETRRQAAQIARQRSLLSRKILLLNQVQQLFHYWHVLHKPFAIIMYIVMVIHVAVAIWTGYQWIF